MSNAPERSDAFLLKPGEKKVTTEIDTRVPNCVLFHFAKEDHTLGEAMRAALAKNPKVLFAGYIVPNPNFPFFDLRVQTDGSITPQEAVQASLRESVLILEQIKQQFIKEWELKKISRMHEAEADAHEAGAAGPSGY